MDRHEDIAAARGGRAARGRLGLRGAVPLIPMLIVGLLCFGLGIGLMVASGSDQMMTRASTATARKSSER